MICEGKAGGVCPGDRAVVVGWDKDETVWDMCLFGFECLPGC